jgi:checkpoint serine/threonine-protein kinase
MTLHTKAATDEIYDMFSQPLPSAAEPEEDEEDEESDEDEDEGDETDGDYTSGGESTTTGHFAASEAEDEEEDVGEDTDARSVASEWSDFTTRKHVPDVDGQEDDTQASKVTEEDSGVAFSEAQQADAGEISQEVGTPASPEASAPAGRTMFVPIPPEDFVPSTLPYRDAAQISNNRLPFMTPIAEKTESSLGAFTSRQEKEYLSSMTPSKENGSWEAAPSEDENLGSSPFVEIINEARPKGRIPQPKLEKSVKSTKTATAVSKPLAAPSASLKDIVPKGPIIPDAQCNPVDEYIRTTILDNLQPSLKTYDGFFAHPDEVFNKGSEIRKYTKALSKMAKNGGDKTTTNLSMPPVLDFPGASRQYVVKKELGAGAFAPVYLLEDASEDTEEEVGAVMGKGAFTSRPRQPLEALKMEDPPTAWEFYILYQAHRRLGVSRAAESLINVYEMHLYKDECYLIEEYRDQGTLLDLVNLARADSSQAGGVMDESIVMFFTIELFRTIESLHSKGLLHGDLKADNCIVRFDAVPSTTTWESRYRRDGSGGWNAKGLALIDFGRGIDMKAFKPDVQFIADWKTGPADCAEMRELRPWTYQIDYHGLAGIIHSMLFGKYIDTVSERANKLGAGATKTYRLKESFKRYWQTDIWSAVFDLLLNPLMHLDVEEGTKMPVLKGMKAVRDSMEEWLEANCEKGIGLKAGIGKLEYAISQRKK